MDGIQAAACEIFPEDSEKRIAYLLGHPFYALCGEGKHNYDELVRLAMKRLDMNKPPAQIPDFVSSSPGLRIKQADVETRHKEILAGKIPEELISVSRRNGVEYSYVDLD